ncbi:hypothetical protein BD413DRAFT_673113 [Trametes elegans]|nr:hypothetical protein BD413DRAFT_673113 [Trametes elegans]
MCASRHISSSTSRTGNHHYCVLSSSILPLALNSTSALVSMFATKYTFFVTLALATYSHSLPVEADVERPYASYIPPVPSVTSDLPSTTVTLAIPKVGIPIHPTVPARREAPIPSVDTIVSTDSLSVAGPVMSIPSAAATPSVTGVVPPPPNTDAVGSALYVSSTSTPSLPDAVHTPTASDMLPPPLPPVANTDDVPVPTTTTTPHSRATD